MAILSKNPRDIHPAYKEAVVDSLLNNLAARLSGRGDFYKTIYGAKPSAVLLSEFLVPMPAEERGGDEEADPIRISAHGLDFQILATALDSKITVTATGAVYVRILPTEDEIKLGGRLEPTFPLTRDARLTIREQVKTALDGLAASLSGGKSSAEWPEKSLAARKGVYESLGLPFDNNLDRMQLDEEEPNTNEPENVDSENNEPPPVVAVHASSTIPDALAEEILPPAKWLRLDLSLPSFEFTATSAEADGRKATEELNAAIAKQLADWAASSEAATGGQMWGYRRGRPIRPSDTSNWNRYLNSVRASKLNVVVPKIDMRWVVQAIPDPVDSTRITVHVALENWTEPLTKNNFKEEEPAFFHVGVVVEVPSAAHQLLRLDRVKPSYRYNQFLNYPAIGFNGGVTLAKDGGVHRLSTTWSPRYVLPRIIPSEGAVLRDIQKLSEPDCLNGLKPLITEYEAWLKIVENHPVDQGLQGPNAEQQKNDERAKLQKDLAAYQTAVHQDATVSQIVLTKPPRPSTLEEKLAELGWRTSDIEPTDHAFTSVVQSAQNRVVVMTPFFDGKGAAWLRELFSHTKPGVQRVLILRSLENPTWKDYPSGYDAIAGWLKSENVRVYNYSIPRVAGGGRETFHAKVVLSDRNIAYLGSSNLNAASLEYSMELGVVLEGKAAADVAVVIDAVLAAAVQL